MDFEDFSDLYNNFPDFNANFKLNGKFKKNGFRYAQDHYEIGRKSTILFELDESYHGWILACLIHTGPDYRYEKIQGPTGIESAPLRLKGQSKEIKAFLQEDKGQMVPVNAILIELKFESKLYFNFLTESTDKKNHGNKREGKFQALVLVPLEQENLAFEKEIMVNSSTMKKRFEVEIQIMAELRDPNRKRKFKRSDFARCEFFQDKFEDLETQQKIRCLSQQFEQELTQQVQLGNKKVLEMDVKKLVSGGRTNENVTVLFDWNFEK